MHICPIQTQAADSTTESTYSGAKKLYLVQTGTTARLITIKSSQGGDTYATFTVPAVAGTMIVLSKTYNHSVTSAHAEILITPVGTESTG
tara:strand:- start:3188 stop:3457 length:270 start_codon:yes stop_codon:yes gene_type:complete